MIAALIQSLNLSHLIKISKEKKEKKDKKKKKKKDEEEEILAKKQRQAEIAAKILAAEPFLKLH
jgi:23S rRNA pseudoU1915 N3-methylase RlmH